MTAQDGVVLKAWLLSPEIDNGNYVITLHGIGDSRSGTAALARLFVVLESRDIHNWVDWLIATERPRNIFAMGESFGAAVLLQSLSIESRFRGVVAECSFANFKAIAEYRVAQRLPAASPLAYAAGPMVWTGFLYARWKYGLDFRAASPQAAVAATSTPVLLIHGLDDKNTPPLHSQIIASGNPSKIDLWLVPGAGHTGAFQAAPEQFRNRVLSWLSECQAQRELQDPRSAR